MQDILEKSFLIDSQNEIINDDEELTESILTITPDFVLKESLHLQNRTDQLMTVSYNTRKSMFLLLDTNGITTWEWRNFTNKLNRVVNYKEKDSREILDIAYCTKHNCYFVLKPDSSIAVFNSNFDEVSRANKTSRTILCMVYNPVTDELLTSAVDGIKVWRLLKNELDNWRSIKPLSSYSLNLIKEFKKQAGQDWVKKIILDIPNCQLYCCTTTDLYIYDFNCDLIKHYPDMHQMDITCCTYSPTSKVIITGSADCSIKIWSITGGLLETLKAHSAPITSIILNPFNSNLIITSALDGTLKMWSLDIMQLVYQLTLFKSEVIWMGLTEGSKGESLLYAASPYDVTLWSITNFIEFWGLARDRIKSIDFDYAKGKSTRIVIVTEQNTILLFNRDKAYQMTIVLPIPKLDNKTKMKSIVYCRTYDLIFVLIDHDELWIYSTKTNPATHITAFNTNDIQESIGENYQNNQENRALRLNALKKLSNIIVQEITRTHRAVEYGLNYLDRNETSICRCISVLDSIVTFYNEEGECCPLVQSFILLGHENGRILFCDPLNLNKKYFTLNCSKDPIVEINQDKINNCLVVRIELIYFFHIKYFKLPNFDLIDEVYCLKTLTTFSRLNSKIMFGFEDGSIHVEEVKRSESKDISNRVINETEMNAILKRKYKIEHKQRIEIIDKSEKHNIFASCSLDGLIKLWDTDKVLIAEIKLDDTLSYCCFCNFDGDLLCGWRNHLFKIVLKRVLPQFDKKDDFYDENDDAFIEDSIIIEDPTLKIDLDRDEPVPNIDLNKYLYPFDISLEKNGLVNVVTKKKESKPKRLLGNLKFKTITEDREERISLLDASIVSTIPESLWSTPRENPMNNLEKVDLTLSSKINKNDLKNYLANWISQTLIDSEDLNKQENKEANILKTLRKEWKFPKFGNSPNETPISSPQPVENEPIQNKEIKNVTEVIQLKPVNNPPESTKQLTKRKLEEEKPKLNKSAKDPLRILTTATATQNTVEIEADVYEPFKNQIRAVAPLVLSEESNIKKANLNKRPDGSSRNKKALTTATKLQEEKTAKTENSNKKKILLNENKKYTNIESRTSEINSQTEERKRVNSIDSKFDTTKEINPSRIENTRLQKISSASSKQSNKSIKSNPTSITSLMNKIQRKNKRRISQSSLSSNKLIETNNKIQKGVAQEIKENDQENVETMMDHKNQESESQLIKKRNSLRSLSVYRNDNDMDETEKAKHLFEYLYGLKGLPPRIRSSTLRTIPKETEHIQSYFKPENSIKNTITTDDDYNFYDSTYLRRQDELRPLSRNFTFDNPYLFEWLSLYEKRSKTMSERLNRVKENHTKIQTENQEIWSAKIERKKSAVEAFDKKKNQHRLQLPMSASSSNSSTDRSNSSSTLAKPIGVEIIKKNEKLIDINNRVSKSAYHSVLDKNNTNNNNNSDKRPKTVSFTFNDLKSSEPTTEKNKKETKSIIRLNEAYLVSQIEMEEILKEAEKRFLNQKNNIRKLSKATSHDYYDYSSNSNNKLNSFGDFSTKIETDDDEDYNDFSEFFTNLYNKNQRNSTSRTHNEANSVGFSTSTSNQRVKTAHRLKKLESNVKFINWDKIPEFSDSNDEDSSDHEQKVKPFNQIKLPLNRLRTPNSIPSKHQKYILVEMPQINLEYSLPSHREKMLLNIRFPKFYRKIITSLTKLDQSLFDSKSIKRFSSANVEPV